MEGYDSAQGLEPDGGVIVWYADCIFSFVEEHSSRVSFFLEGEPLVVTAVSVQPEEAVGLHELVAEYGPGNRRVRHRLVDVADGLEAELSDCHDPEGSQESLVYKEIGLQAILRKPDSNWVKTLVFSREILDGRKNFPRCQEEQTCEFRSEP